MSRSPLESAIPAGRTEKKSKRGIFYTALLGVAGLGAASSVFAASITVNNATEDVIDFAQANSAIAGCDSSFEVALGSTFTSGSFAVDTVTLGASTDASTQLASDCGAKSLTVNFYDSSNVLLASLTGTLPSSAELTTATGVETIGTPDSSLAASGNASSASSGTYDVAYESGETAVTLAADATRTTIEIN